MKYIINVPEKPDFVTAFYTNDHGLPVAVESTFGFDLEPYEPDKEQIENEAWALAQEIDKFDTEDWHECFGRYYAEGALLAIDYQEAKTKYEAWKKKEEEIRVGDEVEQTTASGNPTGLKCVVTKIVDDKILKGITQTGEIVTCSSQIKKWWRKTGRHFPEVAELLKKMKGE